MKKPTLFSIGHSNMSWQDFSQILVDHKIDCLVDVRQYPTSRRFPHFSESAMMFSVIESTKAVYKWIPELGGRRRKSDLPEHFNNNWRHPSFHNYADHAISEEFWEGLQTLMNTTRAYNRVAFMCSESVWWKCHRRIITDYLLVMGYPVKHIMGTVGRTREVEAELNSSALCLHPTHAARAYASPSGNSVTVRFAPILLYSDRAFAIGSIMTPNGDIYAVDRNPPMNYKGLHTSAQFTDELINDI